MAAGISWQGMDALQLRLFEAHLNALKALGGALNLEGETIMTKSKKIVPVDDGYLMNSGFVEQPEYSGHEVSVTLGYGGKAAAYALAVHEVGSPGFPGTPNHPWYGKSADDINWNRPGSGSKYLEKPVKEAQRNLHRRLARRIKRRIL